MSVCMVTMVAWYKITPLCPSVSPSLPPSLQTLSTVGARAFTFVSMAGGRDLLVAANGGSSGNREVNSIVYQFTSAGQLEVVRRRERDDFCVFRIYII